MRQSLSFFSSYSSCIAARSIRNSRFYFSGATHFKRPSDATWENPFGNPVYSKEEVDAIKETHVQPSSFQDKLALFAVKTVRFGFDVGSGYAIGTLTKEKVLRRLIFLETVAGVPPFTGAIHRYLRSLRRMERDHGLIYSMLQEAENERMHLMCFVKMKRPGLFFRLAVLVAQGVLVNLYFVCYLISPSFCHRFVGYLEEEAVHTYTHLLKDLDEGKLADLAAMEVPQIAKDYWRLGENAKFRDMVMAVRADEAEHRNVNHTFSDLAHEQKKKD